MKKLKLAGALVPALLFGSPAIASASRSNSRNRGSKKVFTKQTLNTMDGGFKEKALTTKNNKNPFEVFGKSKRKTTIKKDDSDVLAFLKDEGLLNSNTTTNNSISGETSNRKLFAHDASKAHCHNFFGTWLTNAPNPTSFKNGSHSFSFSYVTLNQANCESGGGTWEEATADATAPSFENSKPAQNSVTYNQVVIDVDIDEGGKVYAIAVADGTHSGVTSAQVKAGQDSSGSSAVASANVTLSSGGFTGTITLTGLSGSTAYDIYVVAEDDEGTPNLQASPTKVDITTSAPANVAPTASSVSFSGTLKVGQTLTGSHDYADTENDTESGTTYKWYISDDASGTNKTAISGATSSTYTLTTSEYGKYISYEVTPNDGTSAGSAVESSINATVVAPEYTLPTISSVAYSKTTGVLSVTGSDFRAKSGSANDIDVTKLTLKGVGSGTHTLTSTNVEITSATSFSITLNSSDKSAVDTLFDQDGTSASDSVAYNLAVANTWNADVNTAYDIANTTIAVTVSSNAVPVITEGASTSISTNEDSSITITLNASDSDGDTITWSIDTNATNGTASVSSTPTGTSQVISYTPTANYNGSDSFVVKAYDGISSDTITINVTINSINDAPEITTIPNTSAIEDLNYLNVLDGSESDVDADDLNWSVTEGTKLPSWLTLNSVTTISNIVGDGTASSTGDDANATSATINAPFDIVFDLNKSNYYISEFNGNVVRKVNVETGVITTFASNLNKPTNMAFDSDGNFYVTEYGAGNVTKIDTNGTATNFATGLTNPVGIAIDESDNVYVAQYGGHVVNKIDANGTSSIYAGTGDAGYSGDDGLATSAQLNAPVDLAFDSKGDLYVSTAGSGGTAIRKIDKDTKIITTIAGNGTTGATQSGKLATNTTLSNPFGLRFDANDNLYISQAGSRIISKGHL